MPPSPSPPEFFIDRSLGRLVVPAALSGVGLAVRTMASVFGDREQLVSDTEWLIEAGRRNWIVLTKDKRIRRRPAEIEALVTHGVRAFVLARGNLTGSEQATYFIDNLERIEVAAREDGPFVYAVSARQIRKLWPREA